MGLFNSFKEKVLNEFIDIIEWTDDSNDTMIWRFPRYQSEIKNGAQLTVRETQVAVLVNEGQFADVYQPGRYELTTQNMPILTTIKGWKYGFNSPFKVDVYFVNTKQFLNMRWGTANPIMLRDPEFGPIRMRAFGSYCFKIQSDPTKFMKNVGGTDGHFTTEEVSEQLRNFVITKFTDYLGESKVAALDLASNLNEFSQALTEGLKDRRIWHRPHQIPHREHFAPRSCRRGSRSSHKHGHHWQHEQLHPNAICRLSQRLRQQPQWWRRWTGWQCYGSRHGAGHGTANDTTNDATPNAATSTTDATTSTTNGPSTTHAPTSKLLCGSEWSSTRAI